MSMAWVAYLASLLLLFYVGQAEQAKNLTNGLIITEIFLVAGPPILLSRQLRYDFRKTFQLHGLKAVPAIFAVLAAASAWVLVVEISAIQNDIFPYPQSFLDAFQELFRVFQARGIAYSVAMMAVLPAVCEEALFRGFIMTGFRKQWGATRAVILTAVMFAVFHLSPYRYLPTGILGVVIGAIVIWTGSLWAGMLAHFVANASSALIFQLTYQSSNPMLVSLREGTHLPVWLIIIAVIVLAVSIRSLYIYYRRSAELEIGKGT
jgi:sodium transport system permease protein